MSSIIVFDGLQLIVLGIAGVLFCLAVPYLIFQEWRYARRRRKRGL